MRIRIAIFAAVFLLSAFLLNREAFAATVDVTITGSNTFSPSSVTINTGDTVRWTANNVNYVEVASDTHLNHYDYPDPSCQNNTANCWDGPILTSGQTYSFTFMIAGTWPYHDHQSSQASGQAGPATIIVNDTRAPSPVSSLASSGATTNSVTLTWTSPGDDRGNYVNYGTPSVYDVRYSTATITEGNWASATAASGEPTPGAAGTSESMTVSGLSAGTTYYFAIKTRDEVPNESAISNILTRATADPSDTTAPAAVTNLSLSNPSETSILLSWTAPGDDGNSGTAQSYDIRYSTSNITDSNWSSATQATGESAPQAAGTSQSMTVSGLKSGTTYFFGLKTTDESNNESGLSNIPNLSTVTPASQSTERYGDIIPPAKILDLKIDSVSTSTVALSWTAPGDDENRGTAVVYDMRYAQEDITLGNWPFINRAVGEPVPKISGTKQSMEVSDLAASTAFYFVVNAKDEVGNESIFSNIISTTTLSYTPRITEPPPKETPKEEAPSRRSPEPPPPPPPPVVESVPVPRPPSTALTKGDLIRAKGDEKVYIVKGSKKLWIPNPEAFNAAGYDWGSIKEVEPEKTAAIDEAMLVRAEGRREVYVIEDATKRHIPNADAFSAHGYKWENILETRAGVLDGYKTDPRFVQDIEGFKIFIKIWIQDLEKSLSSPQKLLITSYDIDVKIYLKGWIDELKNKLSDLDDANSSFYREVRTGLVRGNVEFCLSVKSGGVELCLNTQYYGGGGLDTLFKATEEKIL